jgi:hypothetical protein
MMKVRVKTLGVLKKYLPEEKEIDLPDGFDLERLTRESLGIPPEESRISFVVNGSIRKRDYRICPEDRIVVLKMGGAG